jgi:NAD-dependent deacetylase
MNCTACRNVWDINYKEISHENIRCPKCNSNKGVKPNVVFFGEMAPLYRDMKSILNNLTAKDMLIVMGTMGNVVNINNYAGFVNSYKILNNLDHSIYINEENFDSVYLKKGTEAIFDIKKDIYNFFCKV